MAELTVQNIALSGTSPTYQAAGATGDTFANDGRVVLHVKNGSASAIDVTVVATGRCSQGFLHDVVVSVPAGGERMIGPFEPSRFNNPVGRVSVTYSEVASVTVAALRLPG